MSTSLAEQLKRLQRPQTSQFTDTKKKASLLFDAKEAANKDRETILEIGLSGLNELIALNPSFAVFESTLFDRSSKDLVRSIENVEVNEQLDKHLKKFFIHLSPYFMLQPAHKCLEWLIRRFNIEAYNQDDFCMLILPFYGTRLFVRCVQIIKIRNTKWEWLEPVKKNGLPLAKQTLFNHLGSDQFLMQIITKTVIEAVKIMDIKASSLQTLFGFYCTTVLGTLESLAQVTEAHFMNILPGLLKGLSSTVIDFSASAIMILVCLLTKISIASDTLDKLVSKVIKNPHPSLHQDAVMTLILVFQTQSHYKKLPDDCLDFLISSKWFLNTFTELNNQKINIHTLYCPILEASLRKIQDKKNLDVFHTYKSFCENLLNYLVLNDLDTEMVIKCALNSYILKEKVYEEITTIDSGDDSDEPMSQTSSDISSWYSNYLKKIECQYPDMFSKTTKQILQVKNEEISESRKRSLKTILGFLLTNSQNGEENTDLFENLYHHQSRCRIEAVKFMVKNFHNLTNSTSKTKELIQDCVKERLEDDNYKVIEEVLKLPTKIMIDLIGEEEFLNKLLSVIHRNNYKNTSNWDKVKSRALKHLMDYKKWNEISDNEILLEVFPILMENHGLANQIFTSLNAPIVKVLSKKLKGSDFSIKEVTKAVYEEFSSGRNMPKLEELVAYSRKAINQRDAKYKQLFYTFQMISESLSQISSLQMFQEVLELVKKFYDGKAQILGDLTLNKRPIELIEKILIGLMKNTKILLPETIHFSHKNSKEVSFLIDLLDLILKNLFQSKDAFKKEAYHRILKSYFEKFFPSFTHRIEFLTNIFSSHTIPGNKIDPELQMMTICITNSMLKNADNIELTDMSFLRILIGLNSEMDLIKEQVMKTIEILSQKCDKLEKITTFLVEHKEEILMDNEHISVAVFTFYSQTKKGKEYQDRKETLENYMDIIIDPKTPGHLKANILLLLKHINDQAMLKKLSITVCQILDKFDKELKGECLKKDDFTVLEQIILRLNQTTMKVTANNMEIWDNICLKIIKHPKCILHDSGDVIESPFVKLLEVFDEVIFSKLAVAYQKILLYQILKVATTVDSHLITWSVTKFIKKIQIDGKIITEILEHMRDVQSKTANDNRRIRTMESSPDILLSIDWKIGVTLLENLQNKKDMTNLSITLPILFEILRRCTEFEEQAPVEYTKQILLATILHCLEENPKIKTPENVLKVDLIVQCIRGSNNPQTHHHALQLISHLAILIPDLVLHNIMDIFTFMGSSVVRQDDAYSFQIISKIIESVIPILVKQSGIEIDKLVIPVLKVFADIILDVPEHRRMPMYTKLLNTLGVEKYLWIFMAILFGTHVLSKDNTSAQRTQRGGDKEELPKRVQIGMQLANEFEPFIILESCCKLIDYVQTLPMEQAENESEKPTTNTLEEVIFNVHTCDPRHLRHFRYLIIQFSSTLTSSPDFVNKINSNDSEDTFKLMKPFYQKFIIKNLMCIANMSKIVEKNTAHQGKLKYWKIILHHCHDSLDNAMVLLSNDMFIAVVEGLLKHALLSVRKNVLELLNTKLQQREEFLDKCNKETLINILEPLQNIVLTINKHANDESSPETTGSSNELLIVQQLALISLKLLSKHLAEDNPDKFMEILTILIELLKQRDEIPVVVVASIVVCVAELCTNLGAMAIGNLPQYMPIFLEMLETQIEDTSVDTILVCIITAIHKLIETFPLFISSYLVKILIYISTLNVKLNKIQPKDAKLNAILNKIEVLEDRIGKLFPLRLMVPSVEKAYSKLIASEDRIDAIAPLMSILSKSFSDAPSNEIQNVQQELSNFFLNSLQFREGYSEDDDFDLDEVNDIEEKIINALVSLIMKLSESSFRPLYYKIYDWAIRETDNKERAITFYRLSSKIAEALKSLFVLFAIDFTQNSASLLNECQKAETDELSNENKSKVLVEGILRTYLNIFTYDCKQFMNSTRFETLLKPLVSQLENEIVLNDQDLVKIAVKTVAQMGMAIDDNLWRQLNYEVLLKTRSNNPQVRLLGLQTCVEFARLIGEEYQTLLPETIPFISELMEDEVPEVEKGCQKCVHDLENILNDTLQKYF